MDYIKDILSTRKLRKFNCETMNNLKDHNDIRSRIRTNGIKFDLVNEIIKSKLGGHATTTILMKLADKFSHELKIRVDRLAKRNKNALICWYAENWHLIAPFFTKLELDYDEEKQIAGQKKQEKGISNFIDPSDIFQLLNDH
ncbi:hypothetical protein TVAG_043130 [Trichomonas vaginalis G3]|uniref:Uncharacterized protein n=1 Tax=Trichomonas vaginalis (strain ATCC PRA-98 / G3) TaxID=412133 RepID=A2F6S7_TRIV3|nr:hypothetical protein TVAGG3_0701460 [Trichomonas vaginalis G3]EAX99405.1 hypothetical protein TVAG_043130 [Trichomonas vaginalis G3]KAI5509268.1 hypothetical protein TVAGG3_0701460 [Trichomonas vaginalis G3]|eukprot:XP_001312335.1 hypothetical protein [Trichomonas vaginalis G3]